MSSSLSINRMVAIATRVLDLLLVVGTCALVGVTVYWWPLYQSEMELLDRIVFLLSITLMARGMFAVPLSWFKSLPRLRQAQLVIGAAFLGVCMHALFTGTLVRDVETVIIGEALFDSESDDEILCDLTENQKWQPYQGFVMKLRDAIPPTDSVVYIGDQRAHLMNYLLYPRKLYVLPDLQQLQNRAIETNYNWTPGEDPLFPKKNPITFKYQTLDDKVDESVQQELREMIAARNIQWVVYYDSVHTENSWFRRIEP